MTTDAISKDPNTGHGHVRLRPDGVKARCGGPGLCAECSRELAQMEAKQREKAQPSAMLSSKERGDQFRVVQSPSPLSPCMFCGSPAELSQRQRGESDIWDSAVSCSNADGVDRDECPLFYPPESFYHETKREAVAYWNKWAQQRAAPETKPARDADHCDYPDCEQHWKGLLFDCVQGWLKGDNVVGPMQIAMRALGLPEKASDGAR